MTDHSTDAVAFIDPPTGQPAPPAGPDPWETFLLAYGTWRGITDPITSANALLRLDAAWQAAHAVSRFHYAP